MFVTNYCSSNINVLTTIHIPLLRKICDLNYENCHDKSDCFLIDDVCRQQPVFQSSATSAVTRGYGQRCWEEWGNTTHSYSLNRSSYIKGVLNKIKEGRQTRKYLNSLWEAWTKWYITWTRQKWSRRFTEEQCFVNRIKK